MASQTRLFDASDEPRSPPVELVRKHVNAIAMMPSERKISLLTRKTFNVLLHIAQGQGDQDTYVAPLREVIELTRFDSRDYDLLKKTLKQMISTVVEWQSPTEGEFERWDACGLIAGASLTKHKRTGAITVEWSYAPQLRAQLLSPERYARLSLELMTMLRSHAALALYEICTRYVDNPSHLTARQPWRWWKPVLTGQPENPKAKSEYRYFKRDVLLPAVAEINAVTDLQIDGPLETKGPDNKTIVDLQFRVHRKARPRAGGDEATANPLRPVDLPLIGAAIQLGIRQEEAEKLLEQFGPEALRQGLTSLERRIEMSTRVGEVLEPARWLRAILPAEVQKLERRREPPATALATGAPKRQAKWLEEWLRRRREQLRREFSELPDDTQTRWVQSYRDQLVARRSPLVRRLDTSGWNHQMVMADFLKHYAVQTVGEHWDKPAADELLRLAAEIGDTL